MGSKEEVVIVTQDGHGHIPGQIQEGLEGQRDTEVRQCRLLQIRTNAEINIQFMVEKPNTGYGTLDQSVLKSKPCIIKTELK